jgi:hypothetical protein
MVLPRSRPQGAWLAASIQPWAGGPGRQFPLYAACLDVGLRELPNPERVVVLHLDEPRFYSVHSRVARLAPPGGALLHIVKCPSPNAANDLLADRDVLEGRLDQLQPGWRER